MTLAVNTVQIQGITEDDGRPQGAPPPNCPTPVPTMYARRKRSRHSRDGGWVDVVGWPLAGVRPPNKWMFVSSNKWASVPPLSIALAGVHPTTIHCPCGRPSPNIHQAGSLLHAGMVKTIVWCSQVWERTQVRHTRRYRRRREIADFACRRVRCVARIHQWNGDACYRTQLDGHGVVEDAASVREAGQVTADDAKNIRL